MKWNNIKDGLPKTGVTVLITDGSTVAAAKNDSFSCWQPVNVSVINDFAFVAGVALDMGDITHWAVPELP